MMLSMSWLQHMKRFCSAVAALLKALMPASLTVFQLYLVIRSEQLAP